MNVLRLLLLPVLILSCLTGLPGCSTIQAAEDHSSVDIASGAVFYRDQWTRRAPPMIHVYPKERVSVAPTAYFVPFRVTQQISDPEIVGYAEARMVYQTWLSMELFPAMEFASNLEPYRRDRALARARASGADLMIGGFVTHYLAGGSTAENQLALQIEIYDTHSGQLIWSMSQSALMPSSMTKDYILFSTKTRMPTDPMAAITIAIAGDMGMQIRNWLNPPGPDSAAKNLEKNIESLWNRDELAKPPVKMEGNSRPAF